MRAAVFLRNIIRVAIHTLLVRIIPLHRDFHLRAAIASLKPQHRFMHRRLAAIEVRDEGLQSAFVLEHFRFLVTFIDELDAHAGIQERQFAQALCQRLVVERDVGEYLRARLETNRRAVLGRVADGGEGSLGFAEAIFLTV
jgi:hypothetical protein